MWINFVSTAQFVIKILLGGINAISGEPAIEDMATKWRRLNLKAEKKPIQDYIITPEQLWLDGISVPKVTGEDLVGGLQFEVTPCIPSPPKGYWPAGDMNGPGPIRLHVKEPEGTTNVYDVRLTATGDYLKSLFGMNVKLDAIDHTLEDYEIEKDSELFYAYEQVGGGNGRVSPEREFGIAPGGVIKQCILEDPYVAESWDTDCTITFNFQILKSAMFR
ncbi:hypothetical protein MMC08_003703 [Hypocenomyce scalaris]|nr:hypothetical protein [Hypocenomyce scalaris]